MHSREKSKTSSKYPSFSSTLLDEIYRSIDKNEGENQGIKWGLKQVEDEEMASLRRACLIEKWMEKKVEEKNFIRKPPLVPDFEKDSLQDNDPLFFSSTSISSVSSSGVLSSSDTEYFAAVEKTNKSCFFGSSFPKPIKTKVSVSSQKHPPPPPPPQPETEDSMKSRLEALKIYANLKNSKQPISPGARLTSFINSLFTNGSSKKSKSRKSGGTCKHSVYPGSEEKYGHSIYTGSEEKSIDTCKHSVYTGSEEKSRGLYKHSVGSKEKSRGPYKHSVYMGPTGSDEKSIDTCKHSVYTVSEEMERNLKDIKMERKSKSTQTSVCSSTTSFSRLRLSKFPRPPTSRDKMGSKTTLSEDVNLRKMDDLKVEKRSIGGEEEEEEGDAGSDCSSSELFEIDHLVSFGKKRFSEELPVYETTDFGKNRAIARGLMR